MIPDTVSLMEVPTRRQAFRAAVAEVVLKAKSTLPECQGRIDKAVQLVLQGDVELLQDGHARVASQCQGETVYHLTNGVCTCKDYPQAPSGWCKHRIAAGIQRRALQALPPVQATPPALPEAPASVNTHLTIAGRQVQVTLRDTDEARLLARLTTLLAQYPVEPVATSSGQPEGFCTVHSVQMKRNEKDGRAWYSHRHDGSWCKGKQGQGR